MPENGVEQMRIGASFKNAVQSMGANYLAAYGLGLAMLVAGAGGNVYSAYYEHGTGSEEGLRRRGEFCHRDYNGCATDKKIYENCLWEKSVLRQSARMNSIMLISFGLLILGGAGALNYGSRGSTPKPPRPE